MSLRALSSLVGAAMLSSTVVYSGDVQFQSGERQVALVELFTSEGCSSCPSAEEWLGALAKRPGLWSEFVPVAFHVDYWDGLGWKDRFASPVFTQRQRQYARDWQATTVYTPCLVANGREQRSYAASAVTPSGRAAGQLKVEVVGREVRARFTPSGEADATWDVHFAVLGTAVTKVARGENAGRELRHEFVAMNYERLPLKQDGGSAGAEFLLPENRSRSPREALAVWVTRRDEIAPVQATGGWLPSGDKS